MADITQLSAIKGSISYNPTNNENTNAPLSLPDFETGTITSTVGNKNSNIGGLAGLNYGSINLLDGGAIGKSFDFARGSVEQVLDLAATAFANANNSQGTILDILDRQATATAEANDPENASQKRNQMLMIGLGAMVVVVILFGRKGGF